MPDPVYISVIKIIRNLFVKQKKEPSKNVRKKLRESGATYSLVYIPSNR